METDIYTWKSLNDWNILKSIGICKYKNLVDWLCKLILVVCKVFENKLCVTISICHSEISVWVLGKTSRKPLEFRIYVRRKNFIGSSSDQESA